jgi:hypothetical protein
MSREVLRVWFLCTLLLAGMLPLPAVAAGHHGGCCGMSSEPAAEEVLAASACCCASDAAPVAVTDELSDDAPGEESRSSDEPDDGCECGDSCRCPRCGTTPGGTAPAVRPRGVMMPRITAERITIVPTRTCVAREACGGVLRPPQA